MKLSEMTWPEVDSLDRESTVVLIPTGSIEQHGHHLPLATDMLLVTWVAEAIEAKRTEQVLLTPTVHLGASGHHLAFPGTLSAPSSVYVGALEAIVNCLRQHRFRKFYVLNGHGGNQEPNAMALRQLKERDPELQLAHAGYYQIVADVIDQLATGRLRGIRHACEFETSMMQYAYPDLVRTDRCRDDGLVTTREVPGLVASFDEITQAGSFGDATQATVEKGKVILETAVERWTRILDGFAEGVIFQAIGGSDSFI